MANILIFRENGLYGRIQKNESFTVLSFPAEHTISAIATELSAIVADLRDHKLIVDGTVLAAIEEAKLALTPVAILNRLVADVCYQLLHGMDFASLLVKAIKAAGSKKVLVVLQSLMDHQPLHELRVPVIEAIKEGRADVTVPALFAVLESPEWQNDQCCGPKALVEGVQARINAQSAENALTLFRSWMGEGFEFAAIPTIEAALALPAEQKMATLIVDRHVRGWSKANWPGKMLVIPVENLIESIGEQGILPEVAQGAVEVLMSRVQAVLTDGFTATVKPGRRRSRLD